MFGHRGLASHGLRCEMEVIQSRRKVNDRGINGFDPAPGYHRQRRLPRASSRLSDVRIHDFLMEWTRYDLDE
jgi:hypothetical protein